MKVAILSAMNEEIDALLNELSVKKRYQKGKRTYYHGYLYDLEVLVSFSRWGKVASASTTTQLINDFDPDQLLFTGVAGGIAATINIGDIVVGKQLYQHDMDASPILRPMEVPLLNREFFETDAGIRRDLMQASSKFIENINKVISKEVLEEFGIDSPTVYQGNIASGDQFVSDHKQLDHVIHKIPDLSCVEMEGAAVAQVCYEYKVPFGILRTISDKANNNAHIDFPRFAKTVASQYALGIIGEYFSLIRQ